MASSPSPPSPASLQLVYLVVGAVQLALGVALWLRTRRSAPPLPLIHPVAR